MNTHNFSPRNFRDYGDPDFPGSGSGNCGFLFFGGGSKSSSSTSTATSSTTNLTDNRVAASEGGIAAGTGANVSVVSNDISGDIIASNNDAISRLAEAAADTSSRTLSDIAYENRLSNEAAIGGVVDVARDSTYSNEQVSRAAIGGNVSVSRDAIYSNEQVSKAASDAAAKAASDAAYSIEQASKAAVSAATGAAKDAAYSASQSANAAISGNTEVSRDALDFGGRAIDSAIGGVEAAAYEGQVTARSALGANRDVARDALYFGGDTVSSALAFTAKTQQEQNDLIRYTNEQFTAKLAANSGDAVQNVTKDIVKYGMIAVAVIGAAMFFRPSNSK